jgi:hypothetical protein
MDRCKRTAPVNALQSISRAVLASYVFSACLILTPHVALAGTIGQMLVKDCPNSSLLETAAKSADEAAAVNDDDASSLAREAARQYYRCAHVTDDSYVHDWARFFYFDYLWDSFRTKGDTCTNGKSVLDGLSELAAGSKYSDVRSAATEAYNGHNRDFQQISAQLSLYHCGGS